MSRWTTPFGLLALAGAALTAATPTTAAAATTPSAGAYTVDGGHAVYYKAAAGQFNHVTITGSGYGTKFTIDDAVPITPGDGCVHPDEADQTLVVCTLTEFGDFWTQVSVDLGDKKDDLVIKAGNQNVVHGGAGDDTLVGDGSDWLFGDDGNDTLTGGSQTGGAGDDLLSAPDYEADGSAGNDTIVGTDHADDLRGGPGNDTILGRGGKDVIYGNSGNDLIYGGAGTDKLSGGPGNDRVYQ
jgi:Ca2+-binding RTX toxin-like protein